MHSREMEHLHQHGWLRVSDVVSQETLAEMLAAAKRLEVQFPLGFTHNDNYSDRTIVPRTAPPKPTEFATNHIYPNVGFLEPVLLAPLANPAIHEFIESVVGRDYYLSNTWMQCVPTGTGRMWFHKDPRGSVSFTFLLDSIGPRSGSTCVVPGTQLNTPPADFCLNDINQAHPDEVELRGEPGDIVFFAPEAWHGRAVNASGQTTRRLFFNFYSRSSKASTSWAKGVSEEQVEKVKATLPEKTHRMFELDPVLTARLQTDAFTSGELRVGAKSHDRVLADITHALRTYGKSSGHPKHPGYLLPYTTRLTEHQNFSIIQYLRQIRPVATLKTWFRPLSKKLPQFQNRQRYKT